ncbi:MAG: acetyl-CoA carboxylase, carboxyltransferase subunit beta [Alphaproteobacteria bacterium]|nr:acetyl-CoA carboxylase, carboxyltransferase subunit beta [Alphaproteobacteria bacterium]MDP6621909.1 acetyl-CoA carboxylase, carboxyltransferase subunit beta [Alphaproteobacteria bacterium]
MNWLTNFVRPKLQALVRKRNGADNLWEKCPGCGQMIFHRELEQNLRVCAACDRHMQLPPGERLVSLFGEAAYERLELPQVVVDPLKFRDEKRYTDRLRDNRSKTGEEEAAVVATGELGGNPVVVVVQNFAFMGGSMGLAVGEAMMVAADAAVERRTPLIVFSAAGGARMQEGILSLMQMPRTTIAVSQVREAGLPYIVVLTDPTTGGVTASYAMLGDVQLAEPSALIGFAGQRVIENTIRETLPEGFQRAEYLLDHGMLDMVVHRHEMRDTLVRIVDLLGNRDRREEAVLLPALTETTETTETAETAEVVEPGAEAETLPERTAAAAGDEGADE